MRGIQTEYRGPTDYIGTRIIARSDGQHLIHPYDHSLNAAKNHLVAAKKFADRLEWGGEMVSGWLKPGFFVHVVPPEVK